jgi:hypothetical protein
VLRARQRPVKATSTQARERSVKEMRFEIEYKYIIYINTALTVALKNAQ